MFDGHLAFLFPDKLYLDSISASYERIGKEESSEITKLFYA